MILLFFFPWSLLSIEWNWIRVGGHAHGIVTKTVYKTLSRGGGQGGGVGGGLVGKINSNCGLVFVVLVFFGCLLY